MTTIYQKFNAPITRLASPLGPGTVIRFFSTSVDQEVTEEEDNTGLYLYLNDRIILVVTFRFNGEMVLFNSKNEDDTWGEEKCIPIAGIFKDLGAAIEIHTNELSYIISVDGKVIYTYQKRVQGDANGVSYLGGANIPSHLSDPVAVFISSA